MAVQLGATLVDGFEVSSIQEEGGVVTVTGADNVAYSAPSLGAVLLSTLHASNNIHLYQFCVLDPGPTISSPRLESSFLCSHGRYPSTTGRSRYVDTNNIVSCVDKFYPQEFLPHTFIYDCGMAREGHVLGLPEQEYPGLVKVSSV